MATTRMTSQPRVRSSPCDGPTREDVTVSDDDALAAEFEAHREPAAGRGLPDARGRRTRPTTPCRRPGCGCTAPTGIDNLGGWLTTVVSRVCLDMLRSRTSRREDELRRRVRRHRRTAERRVIPSSRPSSPTRSGSALLVVLQSLAPAERLAFVLHDLFAVPFDDIATIIGRSPAATRQLASRARRRVQQPDAPAETGRPRGRRRVPRGLAQRRLRGLLALLDPDAVVRADGAAVQMGSEALVTGARGVAETFAGRARAAKSAVLDGGAGRRLAAQRRDEGRLRLHRRRRADHRDRAARRPRGAGAAAGAAGVTTRARAWCRGR